MTLMGLKQLLKTLNIPVAYRCFEQGQVPELPYVVYYADEDIGFYADDTVYYEQYACTIELYSEEKDLKLEEKIKKILQHNQIPYKSYEDFLDSEDMYLKAYEIII